MSKIYLRFPGMVGRGGLALLLSQLVFTGTALAQIQFTTFGAIQGQADAVNIIIDDALPNSIPVNADPIGPSTPTAFTDIGIGLVSTGQVGDWTSGQVTSDFYLNGTTTGPRGESITSDIEWTFVNPSAPALDATVDKIGFQFGSTNANTVRVDVFDKDDVLLGGFTLPAVVNTSNIAIEISPGETRQIGRLRFHSLNPGDLYVLGSFTLDPLTTTDIVLSGFVADQPVPLPATLFLMLTGLMVLFKQKSKGDQSKPSERLNA